LAFIFIKKGLDKKAEENKNEKKKFSVLNIIQSVFDKGIEWAFRRRSLTVILAVATVILGIFTMTLPKQQFFPNAQRNQFIIQVFEPLGTKINVTDADTRKIEKILVADSSITSFASFIGTSAPRVYYSFSPVFPEESYAMFLVNTATVKEANILAAHYDSILNGILPNANIDVMEFAQGEPVVSPVEVRIFGENVAELKKISENIKEIYRNVPGSQLIREDFADNFFLEVNVDETISNQMGFTTEVIADLLAIGFHGAPVSVLWEGNDAINITFRLDEDSRDSFNDIANTYVSSPITMTSVPLRQFADVIPKWQTGKITRRNGIHTLTVGCESKPGFLSSEIQTAIQPHISSLELLPGYKVEYGGVIKNQNDTFSQMIFAYP